MRDLTKGMGIWGPQSRRRGGVEMGSWTSQPTEHSWHHPEKKTALKDFHDEISELGESSRNQDDGMSTQQH